MGIVHFSINKTTTNKATFIEFLNDLLPKIRYGKCTLVMDNIRFHHSVQVKELLKAAGVTVRYLPAYSCSFNSIEALWSSVKAQWKKYLTTRCNIELKIDEAVRAVRDII